MLPLVAAGLLLALMLLVYWAYSRDSGQPAHPPGMKSVAVLPFTDLSADGSQGWFAEGLAEELRTGLIRLRGLQVAGGVSSARFGSNPNDLGAVAEALDRAKYLAPDLPALLPVELDLHGARQEWAKVERAMSAADQAGVALLPGRGGGLRL